MATVDLKEYTQRAVELETAIYTQKKLMGEHEKIIRSQRPAAPTMMEPEELVEPNAPFVLSERVDMKAMCCWVFIILIGVFSAPYVGPFAFVLSPISILIGVFGVRNEKQKKEDHIALNANNRKEYDEQMVAYHQKKANYAAEMARVEQINANSKAKYQEAMSEYTHNSTKTKKQHDDALLGLEQALQDLYDQNIIYPKYRNMVAMATISEYLMSGRCYELEGPNGAYNLYEMELRQNIVINQLSSIITNLEQIRNNQFLLYQELTKANQTIDSILNEARNINENVKLTAYFAELNARIAAAPTVTVGRIF